MHVLDERQRRWVAGWEAERLGYGGINLVSQITGLGPKTIRRAPRRNAYVNAWKRLPRDTFTHHEEPGRFRGTKVKEIEIAALHGHRLVGALPLSLALRDRAVRLVVARALPVILAGAGADDAACAEPIALVEAMLRGHGLDAYAVEMAGAR